VTRLYFGYGSNLHAEDFAAFCARHGHDAAGLRALGPAWLPDHAIAFTVVSVGRAGGVLDVLPRAGSVVPGALFAIDETRAGWRTLDHKEDAGRQYVRRPAEVVCAHGRRHAVHTYEVLTHLRQPFVAPGADYLRIVCEGLAHHGHADAHVRAAARGDHADVDVPALVRDAIAKPPAKPI
jgi:hypothetical protein